MTEKTSKHIMEPEFDAQGNQTIASMIYGKIDRDYLLRLVMEHKADWDAYVAAKNALPPERRSEVPIPQISNRLADVILIIIKKTGGMPRWRKYFDEWREEMLSRAVFLILKYVHNFNAAKLASGKNNDPYYYIGMICTHAFYQVWNKMDKARQKIVYVPLNENIYHNCVSFDHYAGVITEEEARRKAMKSTDAAQEGLDMDSTIKKIESIEQDTDTTQVES